ncbi:MAG: RrF2 family transcriptional regulator [Halanaerobiales bacterium]
MKVSTRGRYGLRAMVELAKHKGSGAIPLRKIAEKQQISEQYLEQLFSNLRQADLVKSVRGAKGGYLLNNSPENITVKDIISALEGPIAPVDCVKDEGEVCELINECVTHDLWEELQDCIKDMLNSVTLEDLKQKSIKRKSVKGD